MRLLVDTHALLWFLEGSPSLSSIARTAMEDQGNERYVSHASAWEIAIKASLGKLTLQFPFEEIFPRAIQANGFVPLPPSFVDFGMLTRLPLHHGDPFDRMIVAQATNHGLKIVTRDPEIARYAVEVLW